MKKAAFIAASALLLLIAGCSEKDLIGNLDGSWVVEKYLYNNADKTEQFKSDKVDFTWKFSKDKNYTESWKTVDTVPYDRLDSIYVPDVSGIDSLIRVDTFPTFYLDEQFFSSNGNWILVNSNKFLQLRQSDTFSVDYRIIEHTKSTLKLFKGNEEFWMKPK
jgi:hypothetical protein